MTGASKVIAIGGRAIVIGGSAITKGANVAPAVKSAAATTLL
jgi:hypothetical protein